MQPEVWTYINWVLTKSIPPDGFNTSAAAIARVAVLLAGVKVSKRPEAQQYHRVAKVAAVQRC
jgi:hypothetical protein